MPDLPIQTMTLAPRAPKGPKFITVTATNEVTVFVTNEVTVYVTVTIETTTSIFDTSFIHVTDTITHTSATTTPTTITKTQTLITSTPVGLTTTATTLPTPSCSGPATTHGPEEKHIDRFQVLSIVFGVFILFLLALMWFLVRRFYKMYRAERVMRKQIQTEGTEMPAMRMPMPTNEGEMLVVGE